MYSIATYSDLRTQNHRYAHVQVWHNHHECIRRYVGVLKTITFQYVRYLSLLIRILFAKIVNCLNLLYISVGQETISITGETTPNMDKLVFTYSAKSAKVQSTQATFYFKGWQGEICYHTCDQNAIHSSIRLTELVEFFFKTLLYFSNHTFIFQNPFANKSQKRRAAQPLPMAPFRRRA